jgi:glycosyltransferase involved in cell wall biosynthesis
VIGSEVVSEADGPSWIEWFEEIGISIQPAIYAADKLTEELSAADVLVLPSRWEGAPLSILEAQRLGCVPVAAAVGAVGELITHGRDGILLEGADDWSVASALAAVVERLAADRETLAQLSAGAASRAAVASWARSIAPLAGQLQAWFPQRWSGAAKRPTAA